MDRVRAATAPSSWARALDAARSRLIPLEPLPQEAWDRRHRLALGALLLHALGLGVLGVATGNGVALSLAAAGVPLGFAGLAAGAPGRRLRSVLATAGLLGSAAAIALLTHGFLEAQLDLLFALRLVAMYEDGAMVLFAALSILGEAGFAAAVPSAFVPWPGLVRTNPAWLALDVVLVGAVAALQFLAWTSQEGSRRTFEQVLRHSAGAVLRLDLDGRVTFVNPAAEALTGYDAAELSGRAAEPLISNRAGLPLHQPDGCPVHSALRGHATPGVISASLRRRGGATLPVDLVCAPVIDSGRVVGAVLSLTDMSQRERAESARQVARDQQQEIERLKQMDAFRRLFLNTASHELNTPLTPIIIHVDLLRSGELGALNDAQQRSMEQLHRNVGRLAELVNDVLDVGRMENGRLRLDKRAVDLAYLVDDAVETFRPTARRAGVELRVSVQRNLMVEGDAKRLAQVAFNLVSNALKFTPPAGRISVHLAEQQGQAVITVQDTGIGISAEDVPKLFQPFSQLTTELRHAPRGTGLGLFISKGIVEQHSGTIRAESAGRGKGARFIVTLPLASDGIPRSGAKPRGKPLAELRP
ncbi:MAG: PAS domain-containing sensor histidine kinase [Halobacteriales archaeon]|nr:PAS domain-containing sensor histidine kinase [Halobacteriales archaeon]